METRHTGIRLETMQSERRKPGNRREELQGHRGGGCGATPRRDSARTPGKDLSPLAGEESVHTEGGRKQTAAGDTDDQGQSGADGVPHSRRADLRSGLRRHFLRIPPQEERSRSHRGDSRTRGAGIHGRLRRGPDEMLRHHPARRHHGRPEKTRIGRQRALSRPEISQDTRGGTRRTGSRNEEPPGWSATPTTSSYSRATSETRY